MIGGGIGKFKGPIKQRLKGGIGDGMDTCNLWVVPFFTLFLFAILWASQL
jgi:hypothetical protein